MSTKAAWREKWRRRRVGESEVASKVEEAGVLPELVGADWEGRTRLAGCQVHWRLLGKTEIACIERDEVPRRLGDGMAKRRDVTGRGTRVAGPKRGEMNGSGHLTAQRAV